MQSVKRSLVGIRTDSTSSPSGNRQRCLTVPSEERDTVSVVGSKRENAASSASRSATGRLVECLPLGHGKIGHPGDCGDTFFEHPFLDLLYSVGGLAPGREMLSQGGLGLVGRKAEEIRFRGEHGACPSGQSRPLGWESPWDGSQER